MTKKEKKKIDRVFSYVVFVDPTYKQGWVERQEMPKEEDSIHIGMGILIKETKKAYWFAFSEELEDITSDVMHPQMIPRDCIIKLYNFKEDLFDELFRPKTAKRLREKVSRIIDYPIEDFYSEES